MRNIENIHTPEPKQMLVERARFGLQFTISDNLGSRQLTIGSDGGSHVDLVPEDAEFIGAGTATNNKGQIDVNWGSIYCREDFGYDRPTDPVEAAALLENVRTEIPKWLNEK